MTTTRRDSTREKVRHFVLGDESARMLNPYADNYISTTKYNRYNFFPLALLFQFKRFANIYFLAIAVLQSIPTISPLTPITAVLPLIFVLAVSITREGIENLMRYRSDLETNN